MLLFQLIIDDVIDLVPELYPHYGFIAFKESITWNFIKLKAEVCHLNDFVLKFASIFLLLIFDSINKNNKRQNHEHVKYHNKNTKVILRYGPVSFFMDGFKVDD